MSLTTVLIVDDDRMLRRMLREVLEREDYLVLEAANGKRAIEILELKQFSVDLVLLDLELPDGHGLGFLERIRVLTDVPLIVISGDKAQVHRVNGFERGADDFVQKPIEFTEFCARLKAHLRRYGSSASQVNGAGGADMNGQKVRFGNWILDRTRYQIFDEKNKPVHLTEQEFRLLEKFVTNPQQAFKREELCEVLKDERYIPTPRALDVKITRLRKKIGDDGSSPEIIKTVRGIGYIFDCDTSLSE